ncbi:MAG: endonuclease MutS2 [Oscillospiraceae bacterium]|nr:endonuclease MutS2 [Oscillospiraceae bacterium]
MNKYYTTLELHKVLEMLASETSNDTSRQMAMNVSPMYDCSEIREELSKVNDAFGLSVRFGTPPFTGIKDISTHLKRASSGGRLSLRDLLDVESLLSQVKSLHDWYAHCEDVQTGLDMYFNGLMPNDHLLTKLQMSILSEDELADSASAELASIRRKINQTGARLRSTLDKMIKSSSVQKYLQDSVVTIRDGRFVLPVKAENKNAVAGLVHDTSSSGQTFFIEPMSVVEFNNDIRILKSQEQEETDRIIRQLTSDVALNADTIAESFRVCTILDVYFAKASLGVKMKGIVPHISDDGIIELRKARHPLIDADRVVPIDIMLGEKYNALIITGPNTGGKTVALKTTGLLTLMTMCGLMIPAGEGSRVSIFNNILVDIGDNQSIEQNLSTFSSHMNQVIKIISTADSHTLILLDELGSGTDPVEGAALAVCIIEKLKNLNAKLMVTTHYQELKIYAIENETTQNASCEFDVSTMKPTYRLIIGSPGKSNAFEICTNLGMPADVISEARELVSTENLRFEQVIEKLEKTRIELETQTEEMTRLRLKAQSDSEELLKQLDELEGRKEKEMERARDISMNIIETTKAQSNELLDELRTIKKQKNKENFTGMLTQAERSSKSAFNKMYDNANPVTGGKNEGYKLPRELKSGDKVFMPDLNQKGIFSELTKDRDYAFVQCGIMKMKVKVSDLRLVEEQKQTGAKKKQPEKSMGYKHKKNILTRQVQQELDIRGYASDEGVAEVDMFINNAVLSGLSLVTIIHGKGTGILRKAVHARLRNLKVVKSYRLGVYGEGEDGVTIVELN